MQLSFKLIGSNCNWLSSWSQCRYLLMCCFPWKRVQCSEVHYYGVHNSEVHCTVLWGRVEWGASEVQCKSLHKCRSQHRAVKCSGVQGGWSAVKYIIIIIIIKKDSYCKAGRGRLTPYQSEDPSPTLPTYKRKEEKRKIVESKKERATRPIKRHWTCSWNPPIPHHRIRGQPDSAREILRGE